MAKPPAIIVIQGKPWQLYQVARVHRCDECRWKLWPKHHAYRLIGRKSNGHRESICTKCGLELVDKRKPSL